MHCHRIIQLLQNAPPQAFDGTLPSRSCALTMASPAGSADTLTTILNALRACLRATGDVRKAADKRLQDFEVVPTYCARLMDVVDATDRIDQPTRLLAVVCVHNTIHRHWVRRGRRYTIPDEEKADIRARLLAHMAEPDTRIARRLAIVLARVARTDWPRRWPELLDTLVAALRTGGVTTDRALYTLHRVVKEKSSQARGIGAKAFVQLATVVMPLVAQLWTSGCSALFSAAYVAAARVADVLVLTARRGFSHVQGPLRRRPHTGGCTGRRRGRACDHLLAPRAHGCQGMPRGCAQRGWRLCGSPSPPSLRLRRSCSDC